MAKKVLKKYVKDIGMLTTGGIMVGAGSAAIGKMGIPSDVATPLQSGISTLGSGIGMIAPLTTMKAGVGMFGDLDYRIRRRHRRGGR